MRKTRKVQWRGEKLASLTEMGRVWDSELSQIESERELAMMMVDEKDYELVQMWDDVLGHVKEMKLENKMETQKANK
jgi:hypothetical protein